jgi:hypothetical protein
MSNNETYRAAAEPYAFATPLRNIRLRLDATNLVADLVPSVVLDELAEVVHRDLNPELSQILAGTKPITDDSRFMRVHFDRLVAAIIQEEFIDIVEETKLDLSGAQSLPSGKSIYPFLRVENSRWKQSVPDYQGRDHPDLAHFKIVSMETCIDLIAHLDHYEWIENN